MLQLTIRRVEADTAADLGDDPLTAVHTRSAGLPARVRLPSGRDVLADLTNLAVRDLGGLVEVTQPPDLDGLLIVIEAPAVAAARADVDAMARDDTLRDALAALPKDRRRELDDLLAGLRRVVPQAAANRQMVALVYEG